MLNRTPMICIETTGLNFCLGDGVLENFGFRQWKTFIAWRGLFEYLRGDTSWGEMRRSGFDEN